MRLLFSVFAALLIAGGSVRGQVALSFTDDFADGIGHPGTWLDNGFGDGDWNNGDVVDGQTWIIPFDGDFPSVLVGAKRDTQALSGSGNNIAGRLRVLSNAVNNAIAAIDLTAPLDVGTLSLNDFGDGTGRTGLKARLLSGNGTVGVEIVVTNSPDGTIIEASQINAGTFITQNDSILWRFTNGANFVINFDARSDTFDVVATDTGGNGPITLAETAFDNPVDRIARIELSCFLANGAEANVGSEVSFESISLTGTQFVHEVASASATAAGAVTMEFLSQAGVEYGLESTTELVTSSFESTGAYTIGSGTNQFLYDPDGSSANKAYRIVVNPPVFKPL